jgi:putative membrane protein
VLVDKANGTGAADMQLQLASERTLLAWIRTGLAMMGFGFVVARFGLFLREIATAQKVTAKTSVHLSIWLGTVLVALGVFVFVTAARDHVAYLRRLEQGDMSPGSGRSLGVMVGLALAALGARNGRLSCLACDHGLVGASCAFQKRGNLSLELFQRFLVHIHHVARLVFGGGDVGSKF